MKNHEIKEIITEAVIGFLNEGNLNKVDSVNVPTNTEDAEEQVGDIIQGGLTEEEKAKKEWFKKLAKRVKHKQ